MKFSLTKFFCLFCLLATGVVWTAPAGAQTAPPILPPLEVSPAVVPTDGTVTVSLPANFPMNNTRWRIGIWEHARPAYLGDIIRDFTVRDGGLRTTIRVEAAPGVYDLRLLTNDKRGAAVTQPVQITVPGIRREPGWWLINGSPFTRQNPALVGLGREAAPDSTSKVSVAPLFVPGLKRDLNAKAKDLTRDIMLPGGRTVLWRVLSAGLSLEKMVATDFDFSGLRTQLQRNIQLARDKGESGYLGIGLVVGELTPAQLAAAPAAINKLRQAINEVAPDAALILRLQIAWPPVADISVRALDACASLADAIVLVTDNDDVWCLKAARRIAEEQPNYDLPIFIERRTRVMGVAPLETPGTKAHQKLQRDQQFLDDFTSGATGFVLLPGTEEPAWAELVQRNAPLFIGSVTLEDTGLLPSPVTESPSNEMTPRLYEILRAVQRIPLLARTVGKGNAESFVVPLGEKISRDAIAQLKSSASGGARIYVEGTPETENAEEAQNLASVLGGTFKRAVGETVDAKSATMTLEDPWLFGLYRGRQLPVGQRGEVTPIPGTVSGQAKSEKGKDVLTGPRVVARLSDGSPALIINPVGKGEVVWMPHRVATNILAAVSTGASAANDETKQQQAVRTYYSSIAAYLQPALVQVRAATATSSGVENVRVALRASPKGTLLVALMNSGSAPVEVAATVNARAKVAFDLADERELPLDTRGNHATTRLTIPGNGWKIVAFATTRKDLDDERNAKRLTARLR